MVITLNSAFSAADICRANGWGPGTRLVGDEGDGPTVLRITAVGVQEILAIVETHSGRPVAGWEAAWSLDCRDWRPA